MDTVLPVCFCFVVMLVGNMSELYPDFHPKNNELDFTYLEKYGNRDNYRIPTCFDRSNFSQGQMFEARITKIYDYSKFWMVTKFHELEIFQKYLFKFYYLNRMHYKIPEEKIELGQYCVAFIDSSYYRGVIVGFPCNHQESQEVQIYFMDYGLLGTTSASNVYYMSEKCIKVPQFAVRAALAGMCPLNGRNWTTADVVKFHDLIADKVLVVFVVNVDFQRQIVEVHLCEQSKNAVPIHEILINEKAARYFNDKQEITDDKSHEEKLKYPYLFPSHEALESGKVPATVCDAEYQVQIAPLGSTVARYYRKKTEEIESGAQI